MKTYIQHLQNLRNNFVLLDPTNDFPGEDSWLNDMGVTMDLVAIAGFSAMKIYPNLLGNNDNDGFAEIQLSFGEGIGPEHEIFRHVVDYHIASDATGLTSTYSMTNPNFIVGNFKDSIVEIPTTRGVVSVSQETPRSKVFLNVRYNTNIFNNGSTVDVRNLINLYMKKGKA